MTLSGDMRHGDLCIGVQERLELFLDGELTGSENLAFLTHLKECEDCAEYWAHDETVSERIMVALTQTPESFESRPAPAPSLVAPHIAPMSWGHRASDVMTSSRHQWFPWTWVAAAACLVGGVGIGLLWASHELGSSPSETASEASLEARNEVTYVRGSVLARRSGRDVWQPLEAADTIVEGTAIRLAGQGEVGIEFAAGDRLVLSDYAELDVERLPDRSGQLSLVTKTGGVTVDLVDRAFFVATEQVEITGRSGAFSVSAATDGGVDRIVVGRGGLLLRTDRETRRIEAGSIAEVLDGEIEVVTGVGLRHIGTALDEARRETARLREALASRTKERDDLQVRIDRARAAEEAAGEAESLTDAEVTVEATPETILAAYLEQVDKSNYVSVADPNQFTDDAVDQLEYYRAMDVVPLLEEVVRNGKSKLRRKAAVGLLGHLGFPEGARVVMAACDDEESIVRIAAIYMLRRWQTGEVAQFLLALSEDERHSRNIRRLALVSGAVIGSTNAFRVIVESFYGAPERRRGFWLKAVHDVKRREYVVPFLETLVVQPSTMRWELIWAIRSLGRLGDASTIPLLRDVAGIGRDSNDVQLAVTEAIQAINER